MSATQPAPLTSCRTAGMPSCPLSVFTGLLKGYNCPWAAAQAEGRVGGHPNFPSGKLAYGGGMSLTSCLQTQGCSRELFRSLMDFHVCPRFFSISLAYSTGTAARRKKTHVTESVFFSRGSTQWEALSVAGHICHKLICFRLTRKWFHRLQRIQVKQM